jgi:hypothetical protein
MKIKISLIIRQLLPVSLKMPKSDFYVFQVSAVLFKFEISKNRYPTVSESGVSKINII